MSKKVNGKSHIKNIDNRKNRRQNLIAVLSVFLCVMMTGVLAGCGTTDKEVEDNGSKKAAAEVLKLDVNSVKNDSGEQVFNISLEDFIESFNGVYAKGNDAEEKDDSAGHLGTVDKWQMYTDSPAVGNHKETTLYVYSQEPEVRSVPQIKIYADSSKSGIYQISLAYDDHSYSPQTYEMYKELCIYTLIVMCGGKTEEEIMDLTEDVLAAVDESFTLEKDEAAVNDPIYADAVIEIYPYYVAGDTMEIRIVPAR